MKRKIILISIIMAILISIIAYLLFHTSAPVYEEQQVLSEDSITIMEVAERPVEEYMFGLRTDTLQVMQDKVQRNQSVSTILSPFSVSPEKLHALALSSRDIFDVRKINVGRPYTILTSKDSLQQAVAMIYEPSRIEYVIYHLGDSIYTERKQREIDIKPKWVEGTIEHSLSVSIEELGESVQLTNDIVDVLAWQIDFFRLQKGDKFHILFREKVVEGESIGIENIDALYFEHMGNPFFAFAFDQGEGIDYFDEEGNSIRKALLRYPLEFSRISSRYTMNRFHPVQKRWKAHLGTDFVAVRGTPIRSVGDGIVVEARFSQYNGNYVKIRHNATYTTQYLHMSAIAKGTTAGTKVKQGQVIGYVGSTGLATGDHLCYRFWKNGVQVDALSVELPPSNPVLEEKRAAFEKTRDSLKIALYNRPIAQMQSSN